jgi:LPS sulfotransferase NodH
MGDRKAHSIRLIRRLAAYRQLLQPRPELEGRFLVLSQSRSGTTLLKELLNAHPMIECAGELLVDWVPWPELYVEAQSRARRDKVFGFKVFIHHLDRDQGMEDPARFLRRMHEKGYRLVYLKRENLVRHAMSQMLRKATGVTHARDGKVQIPRHQVDARAFMRHLQVRDYYWRQAERALEGLPHHRVLYESALETSANHQSTMQQLFTFLGLPPIEVCARLKRINDKPLSEIVENYDEIVQAVDAGPYSCWLEQLA